MGASVRCPLPFSATPSAVATIEKLLADLAPQSFKPHKSHHNDSTGQEDLWINRSVQEARQCVLCGKMFASADFLDKHHVRRHPNDDRELKFAASRSATSAVSVASEPPTAAATAEATGGEKAMERMLQHVERALQSHEASLRSLARDEARKIESLYAQLHTESRLVDEMKATRTLVESQVRDAQDALDAILERKDQALVELADVKDQIEFLAMKRKLAGPERLSLVARTDQSDVATVLELKRLEQALALVNATLSEARIELLQLQDTHSSTLKEKQTLAGRLSEAQERVQRLETASQQRDVESGGSRVAQSESGSQTERVDAMDASSQAARATAADAATQTLSETNPSVVVERETDAEDERQGEGLSPSGLLVAKPVQREEPSSREPLAVAIPPVAPPTLQLPSPRDPPESNSDAAVVSSYVFQIVAGDMMDAVASRAQRYALSV